MNPRQQEGAEQYADIICLPHHVSAVQPPMPLRDRAAQFSPFAALTGYDAAIQEAGRVTRERRQWQEDHREMLDRKWACLLRWIEKQPAVAVTCFQPDEKKSGGAYVTVNGNLKGFDASRRELVLTDGRRIPVAEIAQLESDLFGEML